MENAKFFRYLVSHFLRAPISTVWVMMIRLTDSRNRRRWSRQDALLSEWDTRTELISTFIPDNSSVIEFGAGRMVLRGLLKANTTYQPSDIVSRGEGTLIYDLNSDDVRLPREYTHAVLSGVLEYVRDIRSFVVNVYPYVEIIIASYTSIEELKDPIIRKRNGWVSHLSRSDFLKIFSECGFEVDSATVWRDQDIYVFKKSASRRVARKLSG